ncbi:MAG: rod shape-determining protein, partial [Patescibacteria group bacterium]|nr:rod shape-determining protein [Patescibacteria group bacterium]
FKLIIGDLTAENIKVNIGSAIPQDERLEIIIQGKDVTTGLPKEIIIKNSQIKLVLNKFLKQIIESIIEVIEKTPPELVGDMLKKGIFLCGGGALLRGLDTIIQKEIGVEAKISEEPQLAVAKGLGKIIEQFEKYKNIVFNLSFKKELNL